MARKTGPPKVRGRDDGKLWKKEVGKDDWEETEQDVIEDVSFVKSVEIGLF